MSGNGGPWGGGGNGNDDGRNKGDGRNDGRKSSNEPPQVPEIEELVRKGQEQLRVLMGGRANQGGNRGGGGGSGGDDNPLGDRKSVV